MTDAPTTGGGRRAGTVRQRRRIDLLVGLALTLPAVVGLSVAVIGDEQDPLAGPRSPSTSPLTSATVVCPGPVSGDSAVRVARVPEVPGGELAVATAPSRAGVAELAEGTAVTVEPRSSVVVPSSSGATVLDGRGGAAPGIVAGRGDRLAVPECRAPAYDEWLVGVGASARYATTVELVNPDEGDAVVDLALLGPTGPVEEPALRGIEVPGRSVKRIDLAREAPRVEATAAHLIVVRGRVTATVRNTWDPLGRARATTDFLPTDADPATRSLILGLPAKPVAPTLYLANPGADEVRVTPRLVTRESVFTPAGAKDVAVPPQSMVSVDLADLLTGDAAQGVVGIEVESTGPVASSLMTFHRGDLVLLAPAPALRDPAAVVLPAGAKTLLLGGATRTGVIHVTSYDAGGTALGEQKVEVGADRAVPVALPAKAVAVTIEARNTRIRAVVSAPATGTRPGLATLRVRPAELSARIPAVLPE